MPNLYVNWLAFTSKLVARLGARCNVQPPSGLCRINKDGNRNTCKNLGSTHSYTYHANSVTFNESVVSSRNTIVPLRTLICQRLGYLYVNRIAGLPPAFFRICRPHSNRSYSPLPLEENISSCFYWWVEYEERRFNDGPTVRISMMVKCKNVTTKAEYTYAAEL